MAPALSVAHLKGHREQAEERDHQGGERRRRRNCCLPLAAPFNYKHEIEPDGGDGARQTCPRQAEAPLSFLPMAVIGETHKSGQAALGYIYSLVRNRQTDESPELSSWRRLSN